ncbi:hypothetical protein CPB84DRAFT_1783483 [Gymnopilus junonius]|uniref:Uncharacterized protein n=1 Tax=Gymnopilus junonius TaxID=109634 RepID=A0A9P5NLH5_GYMJU|nr:hypothetical protein CPB84DRAFT_1783483 [Gymnopilus junonius]
MGLDFDQEFTLCATLYPPTPVQFLPSIVFCIVSYPLIPRPMINAPLGCATHTSAVVQWACGIGHFSFVPAHFAIYPTFYSYFLSFSFGCIAHSKS